VRTAWVVSPHRANFLKTMLRLAGEGREEIRVVADQRGCPTFAGDLAEALMRVTLAMVDRPDGLSGTYHFVNEGEASWAEFAAAIFAASPAEAGPPPGDRDHNRRIPDPRAPAGEFAPRDEADPRCFRVVPRHWSVALDEAVGTLLADRVR
jgi:dTDP-4-dehydrorhamnose reductase